MELPSETQVLIVGAGPAGLAVANCLAGHGVPFVLVDKLTARRTTSRAAAVHARTLEVLESLGVTETMIEAGWKVPHVALADRDNVLMRIDFEHLPSRYQYILTLPQDRTEAILTDRLEALGGSIERGWEAVAVQPAGDGVAVTLRAGDGNTRTIRAAYVVGADGYHSMVRQAAGIGFTPGTYPASLVLADVHMEWALPADEMRLFLAPTGMALVVAFSADRFRIVADLDDAPEQPSLADMQAILDQRGPQAVPGRVRDVLWSSRFRVHHGVAERYRSGRMFLAGDAAHVHSPAGGQGMNTGIQDAVALGNRLAAVLRGEQPDAYLDGYETERRPVAEGVVTMTDQMTRVQTISSHAGQQLRNLALWAAGHLPGVTDRMAARIAELQ